MQGAIAIQIEHETADNIEHLAKSLAPGEVIDFERAPHTEIFPDVPYALLWKPDSSFFERLPDLKVIFSLGAGVDHIFECETLPDLPIVRFVDPSLTTRMSEWICLQALTHLRQVQSYLSFQQQHQWRELPQPQANEITIGIMGMGELGKDAAIKLKMLGFNVIGYARKARNQDGIKVYGEGEQDAFLCQCHFLVNLMPLTNDTTGLFDRKIFGALKRHDGIASPVFINAGRGKSQVESDIIACLENGTLGGVSLDVFEEEPLDAQSPLWRFDNAIITPHIAAATDRLALAHHVKTQIERYEAGKELQYLVDRKRGY